VEVRATRAGPDHLGEGPCWLAGTAELLRVDITAGAVHRWSPSSGRQRTDRFDGEVGAAVPRANGGLAVALDRRLLLVDPEGRKRVVAEVEADRPANRFNDCRADPGGRLWAGTMSKVREPGAACLYRLDPASEEVEVAVPSLTLSNGMGWAPAGDAMYHIDSTTQQIDVFEFDAADGRLGDRRRFAAIDPDDGLPDGLCVDAEGGVWVCLFGGGAVRRYDDAGELSAVVDLPVANPTCPAFGGADLATLYVTTARHKRSPEQLAAEPLAGTVLALEPGVRGLPTNRFAG